MSNGAVAFHPDTQPISIRFGDYSFLNHQVVRIVRAQDV